MATLNINAFPVTKSTFQGTASDQSTADLPYGIVHADEDVTLTVNFDGATQSVTLTQGEDVTIAGATSFSSTGSVKAS